MWPFIMPHDTTFDMSLWCSVICEVVDYTKFCSYVSSQHHSNGMLPHQKNTLSPEKSHHHQFSVAFPHKVSFYSHSQLVWCNVATVICMHANICVQHHQLRRGEQAAACLCKPAWADYIEMLVSCTHLSSMSLDVLAFSDLHHFQFLSDIYPTSSMELQFGAEPPCTNQTYTEHV
jgi:hypothetical protein